MRSVADELRQADREAMARMSPEERMALAFALGEADLEAFSLARGVCREDARRLFQRQRQAGRRPSRCMSALIG